MSRSSRTSRLLQCTALRLGLADLLLFGPLVALVLTRHAAPAAHSVPVKSASGPGVPVFTQTATPANSYSDYTRIDNIDTDNTPNALLMVTPDMLPLGSTTPFFDNQPLEVFYSASYWYIFHQDGTPIPCGATFDVFVTCASAFYGRCSTLVKAASSAKATKYLCIDNPGLNGQLNLDLFVTPNWNPGSTPWGVYNNRPIGVYYHLALGQWCLFNQDGAPIPAGAACNVLYEQSGHGAELQRATNPSALRCSPSLTMQSAWKSRVDHPRDAGL